MPHYETHHLDVVGRWSLVWYRQSTSNSTLEVLVELSEATEARAAGTLRANPRDDPPLQNATMTTLQARRKDYR